MSDLPTISVVVPNYQGGATLARALGSLVDQGYPRLEILVVDGGSRDGSLDIIRRFEPRLAWWVSEPDRGQSHAINKGFARCTGEVVNWLCADDYLLPGALLAVGTAFAREPALDVVVGGCRVLYDRPGPDAPAAWVQRPTPYDLTLIPCRVPLAQPACYYRRRLLDRQPPLLERLHYTMDVELWAYFNSRRAAWRVLEQELCAAVHSRSNKTSTGGRKIARELEWIYRRYFPERISLMFWQRYLRNPLHCWLSRHRAHPQRWRVQGLLAWVNRRLERRYGADRVQALDWRGYYLD